MSLEDFFQEETYSQEEISEQIRLRIRLSVFAYAYEMADDSLISDSEFDSMCLKIKPEIKTGNDKMDKFFQDEFDPSTGMWIRSHPELNGIITLYKTYYSDFQQVQAP